MHGVDRAAPRAVQREGGRAGVPGHRGEGLAGAALPQSIGRLLEPVRHRIGKATAFGLRWLLLGDDPDPDDVQLVAEMISRHWPDTVALFRPALDRYDRDAALTVASGTPVIAMVGEKDRLVPASQAEALAGAPHGIAVVLPGLGHRLPLEGVAEIIPRIVGQIHTALRSG